MKRILFIQYANSAAYPPLEHCALSLAEAGWHISFRIVLTPGTESFRLPNHPNIEVKCGDDRRPGLYQKFAFALFTLLGVFDYFRLRPQVIYVSDMFASPVGYILARYFGATVIYHEHDCPNEVVGKTVYLRLIHRARIMLARIAVLNILPQEGRRAQFVLATETKSRTITSWNCPPISDALHPQTHLRGGSEGLKVYYHGSINLLRVPITLVRGAALCDFPVFIKLVGYETIDAANTIGVLRDEVDKLGPSVILDFVGPIPRQKLHLQMDCMHVGWANELQNYRDVNHQHFVGASVKAFDYLAAGLPLIIPSRQDWISFFQPVNCAKSCDAEDPASIADCLSWYFHHPAAGARMGQNGRQKIIDRWNHEVQYRPVLEFIEALH